MKLTCSVFMLALLVVFFHYSFRGFSAYGSMSNVPCPLLASISKHGYLGVELFWGLTARL